MGKLVFYILDVFAEEKYAGNQLAVFRNAMDLSDEQMLRIAKEINFSETTFIQSDEPRDGGYVVRIFTPAEEVPFAGHPTLGTASVIRREIIRKPVEQVILNLKVGQIHVRFEKMNNDQEIIWMKPRETVFGDVYEPDEIIKFLTASRDDIDSKFPIQHVSIGIDFIFVPLRTLDAVKKASIIRDKFFRWATDKQAKAVFVFCPQTYNPENDMNARLFADYFGIAEDAATGSANSCLAAYLIKHRYFGTNKIDIRVEQGIEINRPSILYLKAEDKNGRIDVSVGGKVAMVARGRWS
jgi:trans-2,3-dihydro-3-hydroxyanthranilate isomerase